MKKEFSLGEILFLDSRGCTANAHIHCSKETNKVNVIIHLDRLLMKVHEVYDLYRRNSEEMLASPLIEDVYALEVISIVIHEVLHVVSLEECIKGLENLELKKWNELVTQAIADCSLFGYMIRSRAFEHSTVLECFNQDKNLCHFENDFKFIEKLEKVLGKPVKNYPHVLSDMIQVL